MAINFSTAGLARASSRHPLRTVAIWAAFVLASFFLIGSLLSDAVTTEMGVTNNPESKRGQALLEQRLRGPARVHEAVVVLSPTLTVEDPEFRAYVEEIHAAIQALGSDVVEGSTSYYASRADGLVSADRHATLLPIVLAGGHAEAMENVKGVREIVDRANGTETFNVYVSGRASVHNDFDKALDSDLKRSEYVTLPAALTILVIVFGAFAAALLPVVVALVAIILAIALAAIIGQQFQFAFFVENMILMMGLGVGIDYSLFIVSRFREERRRGQSKESSIVTAADTAGRAVFFSGMTVVVALMGLFIVPDTIFRSLSGGAILVVLCAVAAALTLLPAILSLLGDHIDRPRIPFLQTGEKTLHEEGPGGFWYRVAETVMARPVISIVVVTGLLVGAASQYFSIEIGFAGLSTFPDSFQSKQGFQVVEEQFNGGPVFPAEVVIDGAVTSESVQAAIERLRQALSTDPIFGASTFEANAAGDLGLLSVQLVADPDALEATDAIKRLRNDYIAGAFADVDADVMVAGVAAENLDFFEIAQTYQPIVVAFVLGLSFLLLTLVFRSLVVPVKAILMNLLSVGAAYGLIVLVFQKGVGADLLGFQQVETIEAWLPLLLFSILFGLSMDYHVFLLSRIKERFDQTGNNAEAVAFGLRSTGRLITGAAAIMVAVFGGFAIGDLVVFQQMGFGLAVAVLLDATVVRSVLVPASMKLLGHWNWYLPSTLDWLPRLGIEGSARPAYAVVADAAGS
jgi:putative drug exporter of the RND superfamily